MEPVEKRNMFSRSSTVICGNQRLFSLRLFPNCTDTCKGA